MKKVLSLFLSAVIFISAFSCVGVVGFAKGAKLTDVSFTPASELSVYENSYGHWKISYNKQTGKQENAFYYDVFDEYAEGNVITLRYSDGKSVKYTCHNAIYTNKNKEELDESTLYFINSQDKEPWRVGNNSITMIFAGISTEISVEILPTPLEKVEFVPVSPIELIEFGDGEFLKHKIGPLAGEEYFSYSINNLHAKGNKYVVTYKTGKVVTYESDGKKFKTSKGEILDEKNITGYDVQEISPWVAPGNYSFPFFLMGCKSEIPVKIIESDVESIQYIPASAYVFTENFNGQKVKCECASCVKSKGYFKYDISQLGFPAKGDKFIVVSETGTVTEYVKDNTSFKDKKGNVLPYTFKYEDFQAQNHWEKGTQYIKISYQDKSAMVPVQIVENAVKKISVTPSATVKIYKDSNGYWGTSNGKKAYLYNNPLYSGVVGLRVDYINGTNEIYKYDAKKGAFCTTDGKKLTGVKCSSNQNTKAWGLGEHTFDIKYMQRSCKLKVKIVKNPVKSIEFVCAQTPSLRFEKDGKWQKGTSGKVFVYDLSAITPYKKGNKLIVNYTSGKKDVFTYNANKKKFLTSSGKSLEANYKVKYYKNQLSNPLLWSSSSNKVGVEYMGKTTQVRVALYKGVLPNMATISSLVNGKGTVTIKWKHLPDATEYKVFKKTQTDKGYTAWKLIGTTKDTVFVDKGYKKDTNIKYIVHSVNAKGSSKYNKSKVKTTKYVKTAGSFEVYSSVNGMRIKYAPAAGTVDIYRRLKGESDWVFLGSVSGKEEYIWDPNAKTGKTYEYSVIRVVGKNKSARLISKAVTFVASPEIKSLKNTVDGVKITWNKVSGAEEYRIYRREPGQSQYKYIGTTKKISYCDKTVKTKTGKTYKYIVRAVCKGELSGYREKQIVRN